MANPAGELIQLRRVGATSDNVKMSVYNLAGQLVIPPLELETQQLQIPHALASGIYVLQLADGQQQYSIKLVIR